MNPFVILCARLHHQWLTERKAKRIADGNWPTSRSVIGPPVRTGSMHAISRQSTKVNFRAKPQDRAWMDGYWDALSECEGQFAAVSQSKIARLMTPRIAFALESDAVMVMMKMAGR